MKTLYPVSEETKARIGEAFLICSQYPEVFEGIEYKKFCSMFVDVIDDDEDEHEARVKASALKIYKILKAIQRNQYYMCSDIKASIRAVLKKIDGEDEVKS